MKLRRTYGFRLEKLDEEDMEEPQMTTMLA